MKKYHPGTATAGRWAIAALLALGTLAPAQEKTPPSPANAPSPAAPAAAQSEMEKWIANTDAKWQWTYKQDIVDPHDDEIKKLSAQYAAELEAGMKKASAAADLETAVALRAESRRFAEAHSLPEQDEDSLPAVVKQTRATYRAQIARVEKDKAAKVAALLAKYDQLLAQAQTQLTQHARLEDALLVRKKREEVAAAWQASKPQPAPAAAPNTPAIAAASETPAESGGPNLFKNANFEKGTEGWETTFYEKTATMSVDKDELYNGKPSLRIDNGNGKGDVAFVFQRVGKPNTRYRLTGYIKTKDVTAVKGGGEGAHLAVGFIARVSNSSTKPIAKTTPWTKVSLEFTTTDKTAIQIGPFLGWYTQPVTGTAWFAGLSLTELGPGDATSSTAVATTTTSPSPGASRADFVQSNGDALALIKGKDGSGSGFVCSTPEGPMLYTNIHVISGIKNPTMTGLNNEVFAPGAAEIAAGRDIARFQLAKAPAHPLPLMTDFEREVHIGDDVVVLGNSGGGGVVTRLEGRIQGIGPDRIEVSAEFIPGNSGSPIIHVKTGKVVGIATYHTVIEQPKRTPKDSADAAPAPVIRRFGYRLDGVPRWEGVRWPEFWEDSDNLKHVSELTEDIVGLLQALLNKTQPQFATETLRRPATEWLSVARSRQVSMTDQRFATQSFLNALKLMVRNDITAAERSVRYTYFREKLAEERQVRDQLYEGFDKEAKELASPRN